MSFLMMMMMIAAFLCYDISFLLISSVVFIQQEVLISAF